MNSWHEARASIRVRVFRRRLGRSAPGVYDGTYRDDRESMFLREGDIEFVDGERLMVTIPAKRGTRQATLKPGSRELMSGLRAGYV